MNIAVNQVNYASLLCIFQCIQMNEKKPFHEKGTIMHLACVK